MPRSIKVLYFTAVNLDNPNNGGVLVCRNHIRRLAQDPRLAVTLCNAGFGHQLGETEKFAASIGVSLHFISFCANPPQPGPRWPFFWELHALAQSHVDKAMLDIVRKVEPDIVVIDYLFSALFVRSVFSNPIRRVVITLNRELDFYKDQRKILGLLPDPSEQRLAEFERTVYRASNAVVALAAQDLHSEATAKGKVIPPLFDPASQRWSYSGNGKVIFIGNVMHYPNLQAAEWIVTQLAPALESIRSMAKLQIIGVIADKVSPQWRRPNVEFLGVGDTSLVTKHLVESDLFIAPIANNFGSKIKLLDCLSYATPFAATQEALSGVSFLDGVPHFELRQPRQAAQIIDSLLQNGLSLASLSNSLARQLSEALERQQGIWGGLFDQVLGDALPPIVSLLDYGHEQADPALSVGTPKPVQHDSKNPTTWGKVGRNEPCPCGSGKKYKHCHGPFAFNPESIPTRVTTFRVG